jgi:anti-sigma-K factor RskA
MDCKKIKELVVDYMDGSLDVQTARKVDEHLSSCEECRAEFSGMKSMWLELDNLEIEQPSSSLKKNIENMIDSYNLGMKNNETAQWYVPILKWLESWWPKRPAAQFAAMAAVLVIGLMAGLNIGERTESKKEIVQLKTDMNQLRQTVMSSLLDQASVTERIRGLTMSSRIKNADKEFYSTLLFLLNSDSDVNVRLATVNALTNYVGNEYVRHELVKSLALQSSPLVQVSLIDLLASSKESSISPVLIKMINDPDVNIYVKERAGKALEQFI